ncbi:MAG: sulfatase-like hydrolase/transferase, partial [Armatimonadetes bacterium]|nr:sulfatase-like hydrolase/transferase [Armatimonadota bacterium]
MARPNILVITTDQQRYDTLGCYANPHVKTPALDELAGQGVVFELCYAPNPVCAPTRASMYTGRWPHVCGLWANGVDLPREEKLFTRLLADAGHDCGLIGKVHLGSCASGRVEPRLDDGYGVYEWAHHPGGDWGDENAWWRWLKNQPPGEGKPPAPYPIAMGGVGEPRQRHFTHWAAERTIEFLRARREEPFFVWMSLFDPHHPFDPPLEYLQKY